MKHAYLLALLWAARPLAATGPAVALTLAETVERTRVAAPSVRLASQLLAEAEASRVGQGIFVTNPRLGGDLRTLFPGTPGEPPQGFGANLESSFEVSGAPGARIKEADRRVEVAQAELERVQQLAVARAWSAYVDHLLAQERMLLLDQSLAIAKDIEAASAQRLAAGVAGDNEVAAAHVEVAAVAVQQEEAKWLIEKSRLELLETLDLPASTEVSLSDPLPALQASPPPEQLLASALEKRPDLAATKARVALMEQVDRRLLLEAIPKLGVYLGLDSAPASPMFGMAGLFVELPLAHRNQGLRAQARAARQTEVIRLQTDLRAIEREVALASSEYELRRRQLRVLAEEAIPSALQNVALTEQGWRSGRFDIYRFTAASRELVRVRRDRIDALSSAWAAYVTLQRVSGGLSP